MVPFSNSNVYHPARPPEALERVPTQLPLPSPQAPPSVGDIPLVVDMSSNFCARPVDVAKYGVIYAGERAAPE